MTGKRPRGRSRLRWINNTSSHLEEKNISLNDVLRTERSKDLQNGGNLFLTTLTIEGRICGGLLCQFHFPRVDVAFRLDLT